MATIIYGQNIKHFFPVIVCDSCGREISEEDSEGYAIQVNSIMDAYSIEYEKTVTLCKDCYRVTGLDEMAAKPVRFKEDRFNE